MKVKVNCAQRGICFLLLGHLTWPSLSQLIPIEPLSLNNMADLLWRSSSVRNLSLICCCKCCQILCLQHNFAGMYKLVLLFSFFSREDHFLLGRHSLLWCHHIWAILMFIFGNSLEVKNHLYEGRILHIKCYLSLSCLNNVIILFLMFPSNIS